MTLVLAHYLKLYTPPSERVTFTWGEESFEWEPKYLAAISTVYTSIPKCQGFEINERNTIKTDRAARLFHMFIPPIPGWSEHNLSDAATDLSNYIDCSHRWSNGPQEMEDVYCALELCNFLGIKAILDFFLPRAKLDTPVYRPKSKALVLFIPYHQIFMQTNFERGIQYIEHTFRHWYKKDTTTNYLDYCSNKDPSYKNETYGCMIQAYIEFAEMISEVKPHVQMYMHKHLNWGRETEQFGVHIVLSGLANE